MFGTVANRWELCTASYPHEYHCHTSEVYLIVPSVSSKPKYQTICLANRLQSTQLPSLADHPASLLACISSPSLTGCWHSEVPAWAEAAANAPCPDAGPCSAGLPADMAWRRHQWERLLSFLMQPNDLIMILFNWLESKRVGFALNMLSCWVLILSLFCVGVCGLQMHTAT